MTIGSMGARALVDAWGAVANQVRQLWRSFDRRGPVETWGVRVDLRRHWSHAKNT
jgi:hypothetical protein